MSRSLLPHWLILLLMVSAGTALLIPTEQPGPQAPPRAKAPPTVAASSPAQQVLSDTRPSAGLSLEDLRERIGTARGLTWSNDISSDQRTKLRELIEADRTELNRRLAEEEAQSKRAVDAQGASRRRADEEAHRRPADNEAQRQPADEGAGRSPPAPETGGQRPPPPVAERSKTAAPVSSLSKDRRRAAKLTETRRRGAGRAGAAKLDQSRRGRAARRPGPAAYGPPEEPFAPFWEPEADGPEWFPAQVPGPAEPHFGYR
jgi:hypothetical protein